MPIYLSLPLFSYFNLTFNVGWCLYFQSNNGWLHISPHKKSSNPTFYLQWNCFLQDFYFSLFIYYLGTFINTFLNENSQEVFSEVKPQIGAQLGEMLSLLANQALSALSTSQFDEVPFSPSPDDVADDDNNQGEALSKY